MMLIVTSGIDWPVTCCLFADVTLVCLLVKQKLKNWTQNLRPDHPTLLRVSYCHTPVWCFRRAVQHRGHDSVLCSAELLAWVLCCCLRCDCVQTAGCLVPEGRWVWPLGSISWSQLHLYRSEHAVREKCTVCCFVISKTITMMK